MHSPARFPKRAVSVIGLVVCKEFRNNSRKRSAAHFSAEAGHVAGQLLKLARVVAWIARPVTFSNSMATRKTPPKKNDLAKRILGESDERNIPNWLGKIGNRHGQKTTSGNALTNGGECER
jgi:hypothetical protein